MNNQLLHLFRAPNNGFTPPKWESWDVLRWLGTRKKKQGLQIAATQQENYNSRWPALHTSPADFTTEETNSQRSTVDHLQMSSAFTPQVFIVTDASHLSHPLLFPLQPLSEPRGNPSSQLRPLQLWQCKMPAYTPSAGPHGPANA